MNEELYGEQSYIEHFRTGGAGSVVDGVLLNAESRRRKAKKIISILQHFTGGGTANMRCLDIGCSGGHITMELAEHFGETVGIDTDAPALEIARGIGQKPGLTFEQGSATAIPYPDESFDVAICNHVYEHINDQEGMLREIWRVLKPGGICYFGAGSRFVVVEPHYRLPFLSWPPRAVSNLYLRATGRGHRYLENHRGYRGLRALVRGFRVHDYTAKVLARPDLFCGGDPSYQRLPTRWLPERAIRIANPLMPTYIWLLEKRADAVDAGSSVSG